MIPKGAAPQARKPARLVPVALLAAAGLLASGSAVAASPTVSAEPLVKGLELPWDMAFLPDGTMFYTEKCKGLSVRLPSGQVNKLVGINGSSGYSLVGEDLFCDGQAGVMGVAVKGPLQEKHEEEAGEHPGHRRVEVAGKLEVGVGQKVEKAHAEHHARREREEHLHAAVAEREERDRRAAGIGRGRDQEQIADEAGDGRGLQGDGGDGGHGRKPGAGCGP